MESPDFNAWLVNDLKLYLLQFDVTSNDIKGSGKNGNVIKKDYVRAAYKIYKLDLKSHIKNISKKSIITSNISNISNEFPLELTDIVPNIVNYLDMTTIRSLNKKYHMEHSLQNIIYNFIIKNTNYDNLTKDVDEDDEDDEDISNYFSTEEEFKMYQKEKIDILDEQMLQYLAYLIYLIINNTVYTMDKESSTPYQCNSFVLYKNQLLLIHNDNMMLEKNNSTKIFKPENKNTSNDKVIIYDFIQKNFDDYDYERMVNYYFEDNDIKEPSYKKLMNYQKILLTKSDNDMINFLLESIRLIEKEQMCNNHTAILDGFKISGFIFIEDTVTFFNER
jgi:hypothetical protein